MKSIPTAYIVTAILLVLTAPGALAQKKKNVDIEIVGVAPDGNSLILNPDGNVPVYSGKKVRWFIGPNATTVESFKIERKEIPGSEEIFYFFDRPPGSRTRDGKGRVDLFEGEGTYIYSIIWYDANGNEHTFDPKISIDPSKFEFLEIIIMTLIGLVPVLGIVFAARRVNRNRAKRNANRR